MNFKSNVTIVALLSFLPVTVLAQDPLTTHDLPEFVTPSRAPAGLVQQTNPVQEFIRYRIVLIHDQQGCGTCKVMSRTLDTVRVRNTYPGLDFVTLDYSKKTKGLFLAAAASMGVGEAVSNWASDKVKPGSLLVVDLERQAVIREFKHNTKDEELARALKELSQ